MPVCSQKEHAMKNLIYGTFVILGVMVCICPAAPEPAIVPGPDNWTMDIRFEHPQQILFQTGSAKKPSRFWYVILTLTNRTNKDVDFYPKCDLMTDTFQVIEAGKGLRAKVFEQIRVRHKGRYPFLESLELVNNKILAGQDNTRDIVIVWPEFEHKAKNVKLFIAGLSNETVVIDHPAATDENGEPVKVYLRKTLELSYAIAGDPELRDQQGLTFKGKGWVMR